MISSRIRRVIIARHRIDFRRSFDGLLGESYRLGFDPYAGDCMVFVKRDRTQIRVLVGDEFGLFLTSRRFDGGRIKVPWVLSDVPQTSTVSHGELALLLDGASFTLHRRVKPWRGSSQ